MVLEAAQKAGVHQLILQLPDSYDTLLGPKGFNLSGGQRQRVALARAFYGNPKLIVLDEPNANLDEAGELALSQSLRFARKQNSTVILITQRPQILAGVDKILRLHAGNVDFFGSRAEFIEKLKAHKRSAARQRPPDRLPGQKQSAMSTEILSDNSRAAVKTGDQAGDQ